MTDVRMPPDHTDDGLRAAIEIRRARPQTGVLVLSHYVAERSAFELVGASADGVGYLLKDRVRDLDDFVDAVRRVAHGGSALDPEVITRLLGRHREDPLVGAVTARARGAALVAEGRSNYGIAERLVISEGAVEKNVHRILRKLDIPLDGHRRVLAVLAFLRGGSAASRTRRGPPLHRSGAAESANLDQCNAHPMQPSLAARGGPRPGDVSYAGQKQYTPAFLDHIYDRVVVGFSNRYVWRCRSSAHRRALRRARH